MKLRTICTKFRVENDTVEAGSFSIFAGFTIYTTRHHCRLKRINLKNNYAT